MPIDEVPEKPEKEVPVIEPEGSGSQRMFLLIFVVLAALIAGEIYSIRKISTTRDSLEAQQAQTHKQLADIQDQLTSRLSAIENSNAQQFDALKNELDSSAKRLGATGGELKRARAMVAKLQSDQQQQAEELQRQLALKADQQQVGALGQDVTAQRVDLDNTKKAVDSVRSDLGMARSELGTLIARNHDDIEQLRKMGERDYYEFTVTRKSPARVAGVGLTLTKTNVKKHQFNMDVVVDDLQVTKKDRAINEPIFFYVNGSKRACELVVNEVKTNQVKGYVSVPKGVKEVAARAGDTQQ
jgi:hypothetical protein